MRKTIPLDGGEAELLPTFSRQRLSLSLSLASGRKSRIGQITRVFCRYRFSNRNALSRPNARDVMIAFMDRHILEVAVFPLQKGSQVGGAIGTAARTPSRVVASATSLAYRPLMERHAKHLRRDTFVDGAIRSASAPALTQFARVFKAAAITQASRTARSAVSPERAIRARRIALLYTVGRILQPDG